MRISELVKELNAIKERHGDIEALYDDKTGEEYKPVAFIEVGEDCDKKIQVCLH